MANTTREEQYDLLLTGILKSIGRERILAEDLAIVCLHKEKQIAPTNDLDSIYRYGVSTYGAKLGKMLNKLREKLGKVS